MSLDVDTPVDTLVDTPADTPLSTTDTPADTPLSTADTPPTPEGSPASPRPPAAEAAPRLLEPPRAPEPADATQDASASPLTASSAFVDAPPEARPPLRRPRLDPPTLHDATAVDLRPRATLDTPRAVDAPEPARPLPPEAPPRLPEHLSVQVDDPQGDWTIDVRRHTGHVDLDIRASAEVQQVVRDAEPELRSRLAGGDSALGQLSFSQGSPRREHAPPEPPAPPRAPRVVRAPPAALRVGRLLDRDA